MFSCAIPFTLFGWGEQRVASAVAGVMNGSTVLFTALVGLAWGGAASERLTPRVVLGLMAGFIGVGVASGIGGPELGEGWDGVLGAGSLPFASAVLRVRVRLRPAAARIDVADDRGHRLSWSRPQF